MMDIKMRKAIKCHKGENSEPRLLQIEDCPTRRHYCSKLSFFGSVARENDLKNTISYGKYDKSNSKASAVQVEANLQAQLIDLLHFTKSC